MATAELSRRVEKVVGERVAGASVRPGERWMRRGRVELLEFLDLGQPPPHAVEQLVTLGRRRAFLKPSRHLAQLYRSFFDSKHRLKVERVRFTKLVGLRIGTTRRRLSPAAGPEPSSATHHAPSWAIFSGASSTRRCSRPAASRICPGGGRAAILEAE
jgi:hypothetical protein